MNIRPRPGGEAAITKIVWHLNVGPEIEGGANALARWLQGQPAGYHEIIDDRTYVQCAAPAAQVEGASGMNEHGYHMCLIAFLQTAEQWADAYSSAELDIAARRCAQRCHDFNVPPKHLSVAEVADPAARGICDHWAVNRAIVIPAWQRGDHSMGPGDHTDVGANFPWDTFMAKVVHYYGGMAAPKGEEMAAYPSPTKPPDRFRGAIVDLANKHITLANAATCDPAPTINNPNPWLTSYAGPGPHMFTVVTANDYNEYHFTLT